MPTTNQKYAGIEDLKADLQRTAIRKEKMPAVYFRVAGSTPLAKPAKAFTEDGKIDSAWFAGFKPLGALSGRPTSAKEVNTDGGIKIEGDTNTYRDEVLTVEETFNVTVLETLRLDIVELTDLVDLTDVQADADNGEVIYDLSDAPASRTYELITISVDEEGVGPVFQIKASTKMTVSKVAGEEVVDGRGVARTVEFKASSGNQNWVALGGPGFNANVEAFGYTRATGG